MIEKIPLYHVMVEKIPLFMVNTEKRGKTSTDLIVRLAPRMSESMNRFEKDAFSLERFIHKRLPLKAKPTIDALANDVELANKLNEDEATEFDGVVYLPRTRTLYCSFYDSTNMVAVLVPVEDLIFEDTEVRKKVRAFSKKYFA